LPCPSNGYSFEIIGMQPGSTNGGLKRIIRALRQITVAGGVLGSCLLVGAFVMIPILGFASGDVGAVGIWCLLLSALTACLLLAAAVVNRSRSGQWYFGDARGCWTKDTL
jgi:hypothetical protein